MSRIKQPLLAVLGVVVLVATTAPRPAHAWSLYVHELICEMAFQQLAFETRRTVIRLSSGQNRAPGIRTFAESCEWADHARDTTHRATYEYHFINVPRARDDLVLNRDCNAYDCVTNAIVRYAIYLARKGREEDRAEALRFLGHFIGDLHQPLHVGNVEDRGGNELFIRRSEGDSRTSNLHGTWDGFLPELAGLRPEPGSFGSTNELRRLAEDLVAEITPQQAAQWRASTVAGWAEESFQLARNCAYRIDCDPNADKLQTGGFLSSRYKDVAQVHVKLRVKAASVRLAHAIEMALADGFDAAAFAGF